MNASHGHRSRARNRGRTIAVTLVLAGTAGIGAAAWASTQIPVAPQQSSATSFSALGGVNGVAFPAPASAPSLSSGSPYTDALGSKSSSAAFAPATSSSSPVSGSPAAGAAQTGSEKDRARIPQPVSPPVPLTATVTLSNGAKIKIANLESVQGETRGPGEIAGPSIRFQVIIDNASGQEVQTTNLLVNVESGAAKTPALQLSGPGVATFSGPVSPHGSASATYVFNVPMANRDAVRILVNYGLSDPIADFEGSATKAGA